MRGVERRPVDRLPYDSLRGLYCELYGLVASTTMAHGVGRHSAELWPNTGPADAITEQASHDGLISLT